MKLIIAGSRRIPSMGLNNPSDWKNKENKKAMLMVLNQAIIKSEFKPTEIVSGTAWGLDTLGEQWAEIKKIPVVRFPADWENLGKGAGFIRNGTMADYGDALICLMSESSSGSQDMINKMKKLNKPTFVIVFGIKDNNPYQNII